jgi:hypothetical protein
MWQRALEFGEMGSGRRASPNAWTVAIPLARAIRQGIQLLRQQQQPSLFQREISVNVKVRTAKRILVHSLLDVHSVYVD